MGKRGIVWILTLGLWAPSTFAASDDGAVFFRGWEGQAGVEGPTDLSLRLKAEFPSHFFLKLGMGYMPLFFGDTVGSFAGGMGIVGSNTGKVIGVGIENSFVMDLRWGWASKPGSGFFIEGGYKLITGGGGDITTDDAEKALNLNYAVYGDEPVTTSVIVHSLTLHGGYTFLLPEGWTLTADLGITKPVASRASVSVSYIVPYGTAQQINKDLSDHLQKTIRTQLWVPTASVWLGYVF